MGTSYTLMPRSSSGRTPGSTVPASVSNILAFSDFSSGTLSPFVGNGSDLTKIDVVADPTGSGRGNVGRIHYLDLVGGHSADFSIKWHYPQGIGLGQSLWFKGDVYIPTGGPSAQRKLIYWQSANWNAAPWWWAVVSGFSSGNAAGYHCDGGSATGTDPTWDGASGALTFGTWHTLKVQIQIESAFGATNGKFNWWQDGVLISTAPHLGGGGLFDPNNFQFFDPAWSGVFTPLLTDFLVGEQEDTSATGAAPYDEFRYWDNITFSTADIP